MPTALPAEMNILNGNGAVKQAVAIGAVEWGWSDTDDYFLAVDSGMPVTAFPARLPSAKDDRHSEHRGHHCRNGPTVPRHGSW